MKGIIFNLLETVVTRDLGEDTWDALLDTAGLGGAYTSVGTYPHEELLALVGAASDATGRPADDLVRWFGREAIPLLYERYAVFFDPHTGTRAFLLTLNDVIHPEVRKLYPGASTPVFSFDTTSPTTLLMEYKSERSLCSFAEGLINGTGVHYGEQLAVEHTECKKRGDERCLLSISAAA